jgi:hypothetical protein
MPPDIMIGYGIFSHLNDLYEINTQEHQQRSF